MSVCALAGTADVGTGVLVDSEEVVGRFAFKEAWLDARGVRPGDLAVVSAGGDSMEPTVRDSDILLVDTSVKSVRSDGFDLIEQRGELPASACRCRSAAG